ncbi:MAG: dihydroorotase [Nitrospirota bacterium]|nr:dihydroorotase [Nitrospirota bacterium]
MIVIAGGWVLDPGRWNGEADLWIRQGHVEAVMSPDAEVPTEALCIDATGLIVAPGFVDLHVHFREPGFEYKETIATGTAAAAAGGFTTVCCMPNTKPVNDTSVVTEVIRARAREAGLVAVCPIGAITKGLLGKALTDFHELQSAGCVAVSDDGRPVMDDQVMRQAMQRAQALGLPVVDHCEDVTLAGCGCMAEGPVARALGVRGIPPEAESRIVERDLILAKDTGCHVHIAHISTAQAVQAVRRAKAEGVRVTAEACPHHFLLTDEAVQEWGALAKMNPPLRRPDDVQAVRDGLCDGTIDAIATDHAPHAEYEKQWGMDRAPFGIVGLETALGLTLRLVEEGVLSMESAIEKLTSAPARLFGLSKGTLAVGADADVVMIDHHREWTVDPKQFLSKGRNTPFAGWRLRGQVVRTFIGGTSVYQRLLEA